MDIRRQVIAISAAAALAVTVRLAAAQAPFPFPQELRGDPLAGEQVYRLRGCAACHGTNGRGGKMGPDLNRPGPRRDFAWYRTYLSRPQSYVPTSIKPPTIISDKEMRDLVAYLFRLKGLR